MCSTWMRRHEGCTLVRAKEASALKCMLAYSASITLLFTVSCRSQCLKTLQYRIVNTAYVNKLQFRCSEQCGFHYALL
jgi:hypothetical protein